MKQLPIPKQPNKIVTIEHRNIYDSHWFSGQNYVSGTDLVGICDEGVVWVLVEQSEPVPLEHEPGYGYIPRHWKKLI